MRTTKLFLLATAALVVAIFTGCGAGTHPDQSLVAPTEISHAPTGGTEGFFFMPPIARAADHTGVFDDTLLERISVTVTDPEGGTVAAFTSEPPIDGNPSEGIRLEPETEQYLVNFHTNEFALDAETIYRIHVYLDGAECGFADIQMFTNMGKAKRTVEDDTFALVDGRTLVIKFRIEQGPITGYEFAPSAWDSVSLGYPCCVTIGRDDGTEYLYVVENRANRVTKYTLDGAYVATMGDPGSYYWPRFVAVAPDGCVWITEHRGVHTTTGDILKFSPDGTLIRKWNWPANLGGIAVQSDGSVLVSEVENRRVVRLVEEDGDLLIDASLGDDVLTQPWDVAVDPDDNIFIGDGYVITTNHIVKFSPDGLTTLAEFGTAGTGDGEHQSIPGFGIDALGNVFTTDYLRGRIQKFTNDGAYCLNWGSGEFSELNDVAIDAAGFVYAADAAAGRVRKYAPVR